MTGRGGGGEEERWRRKTDRERTDSPKRRITKIKNIYIYINRIIIPFGGERKRGKWQGAGRGQEANAGEDELRRSRFLAGDAFSILEVEVARFDI